MYIDEAKAQNGMLVELSTHDVFGFVDRSEAALSNLLQPAEVANNDLSMVRGP